MGGAWVIGHRLWNAHLGMRLADTGCIVVAVDYRNFPQGQIPDMVEDLNAAMDWVFGNIGAWGGDHNHVGVVAQSAGAHLAAFLLLKRAIAEAQAAMQGVADAVEQRSAWSVQQLKGFLGVSGPYDFVELEPVLDEKGLRSFLRGLCADGDLHGASPARLLQTPSWHAQPKQGLSAAARMPPVYLFHGADDHTVPASSSSNFAHRLTMAGVAKVTADVRPGVSHSDPIIEGPMRGDEYQAELVLQFLVGEHAGRRLREVQGMRMMIPRALVSVAARFMPF
mmetsp:Transcript_86394/g.222517  ORF Transcript_86394/g.222517 Transcript_86394/m.222517 type:complete len:280 (+) Transcript_86394:1-840(+)